MKRLTIMIGSKDRPTEVFGLLQSLRSSSFQDWDLVVVDDASGTPIMSFYFINYLVSRLASEGHSSHFIRNNISFGVSRMRNQCVNAALKYYPDNDYLLRIDDDTLVEPDFLEKLFKVLDAGYDLASGVTPPLSGPDWVREVKFVEPIINEVVLDGLGGFLVNSDDCGYRYDKELILPAHHFRSTALYHKKVHTEFGISYPENLSKSGMREEEFFSFKMIIAGLKLGVNTQALHWHLMTPSGGQRTNAPEVHLLNQKILNKWVRKLFKENGNFIEKYNERLGIPVHDQFKNLKKATNFIMTKEE